MCRNRLSWRHFKRFKFVAFAILAAGAGKLKFSVASTSGMLWESPQNPWYPESWNRVGMVFLTKLVEGWELHPKWFVFSLTPSGQLALLYSFGGTFVSNEGSVRPVAG